MLTPAPTSCTGGSMTGPTQRLVADRHHDRARAGAEGQHRDAAQYRREPDRRHDDRDDRPAEQRPQHDPFETEAERDHAGDRQPAEPRTTARRAPPPPAMKPANMTNSPCAKLIASVAL